MGFNAFMHFMDGAIKDPILSNFQHYYNPGFWQSCFMLPMFILVIKKMLYEEYVTKSHLITIFLITGIPGQMVPVFPSVYMSRNEYNGQISHLAAFIPLLLFPALAAWVCKPTVRSERRAQFLDHTYN